MIAVIDYGICNVRSVTKALEEVGADVIETKDGKEIMMSDKLVLPGVGSFKEGITKINELGLRGHLQQSVINAGKPFLGICLGAQMTARKGFEYGEAPGFGWIGADVVPFDAENKDIRVPHMGWNDVHFNESILFRGLKSPTSFYFVHSFFLKFDEEAGEDVVATCDHGHSIPAAVSFDNIHLVQFHPEKSQKAGLKVLENFLELG
jgi:imidazole glycerol-phosphate synthase subunit HisH